MCNAGDGSSWPVDARLGLCGPPAFFGEGGRRRDSAAAREFFTRALRVGLSPVEVTTDRAPV